MELLLLWRLNGAAGGWFKRPERKPFFAAKSSDSGHCWRMDPFDRKRIEDWQALADRKRRLLDDIAAGRKSRPAADIDRVRGEAEQLESLIAFYSASLTDAAA
ncbi:MAG TPA: hypothetical protein VGN38_02870 [Caulobacteraceae bacterium]|nr:hypothetical protein [Caulobacteraceae bacterium]